VHNKKVVFSILFGEYDVLRSVRVPNPTWDFICVTDRPRNVDGWQDWIIQVSDPLYESREWFITACDKFPSYEYSIMHGGNAVLLLDPDYLLRYILEHDMALFKHPHRDCVYEEAKAVMKLKKAPNDAVIAQMRRYYQEGLPKKFGLSANTLAVKHHSEALRKFERRWWYEVQRGSHRDQLALDYCRWKTGYQWGVIPGDPFDSPLISLTGHRR
jgi:hypothetical protein